MLAAEIREVSPKLPLVLFFFARPGEMDDSLFAASLAKPIRQSQLFDTLRRTSLGHDEVPKPATAPVKPSMDPGMAHAIRCASCWPRTTS